MMEGCHDMGVILGRVDRAACAGHPMGIAVFDITDLDDPEFLYSVEVDEPGIGNTVHGWHSAAFTGTAGRSSAAGSRAAARSRAAR